MLDAMVLTYTTESRKAVINQRSLLSPRMPDKSILLGNHGNFVTKYKYTMLDAMVLTYTGVYQDSNHSKNPIIAQNTK